MNIQDGYVAYTEAAMVTMVEYIQMKKQAAANIIQAVQAMSAEFPILRLKLPEYYMALENISDAQPALVEFAASTKARWIGSLDDLNLVDRVYASMGLALCVTTMQKCVIGQAAYQNVLLADEAVAIVRDNPVFQLSAHAHIHISLAQKLQQLYDNSEQGN